MIKKVTKAEKTLLDTVEEELKNDGIVQFKESVEEEYLSFPSDFSSLPTPEVGKYLNAYTQKKGSVRTLITRYNILLDEAQAELDKHKATLYEELPAKMSLTEKELKLMKYEPAQTSLEMCRKIRAKISLAENYYDSLKDAIFNVSRHITLNISDDRDERREHNTGQIKRGWQ